MLAIKASLPPLTGLFLLFVSGVNWYYGLCRPWPTPSSFRNVLFSCQICVMITYGIDFLVSILSDLEIESPRSTADTIHTSGSLLLWIFCSSTTRTSMRFISLERRGCWVIYGVAETVFMARHLSVGTDNRWTTTTVSSMFRLGSLYILCSLSLSPDIADLVSEHSEPLPDEGDPSTWDTMQYLFPFSWPAENAKLQVLFVGLIIWLLLQRWVHAVVPMQQGRIIDHFYQGNGFPWRSICHYISLEVFKHSNYLGNKVLWIPIENWSRQTFQPLALRQVMDQSAAFHDNKRSAALWQSVTRESDVHLLFKTILLHTIPHLIDFCVAACILPQLFGVQIAFVTAVNLAAYLSLHKKITRRVMVAHRNSLSASEECRSAILEMIQHWSIIASFNRIEDEMHRFADKLENDIQGNVYFELWILLQSIVELIVLNVGVSSTLLLTAYQIHLGKLPVGHLVTLLSYWRQLTTPLTLVAKGFQMATAQIIIAKKTIKLMQARPTVTNCPGALPLEVDGGRVEFQSVSFGYDDRRRVLQDITLTCEPGQTIALVGQTGAGKSTILRLLCRDYDACSGSIKIDGQETQEVTINSLRSAIARVPQHPEMLNRTIMENLRYGNPHASDEEVYQVCKDVQIYEEFSRIGFDHMIGEDGVKLSGGQKQRIAIVRAVLKKSPIITFDEPTSEIDTVTESNIQRNLVPRLQGCTVFIAAHRLSTVISAHQILVIENGKIVQRGTHEQLKDIGLYGQLWAEQIASTKDESSDISRQ